MNSTHSILKNVYALNLLIERGAETRELERCPADTVGDWLCPVQIPEVTHSLSEMQPKECPEHPMGSFPAFLHPRAPLRLASIFLSPSLHPVVSVQ